MKNIKEKLIGLTGSVSGFASILGSWQICHNVCLALIAFLSILGITLVGMPLAFLTTITVPIWIFALILLLISTIIYFKKKCISKNLIITNSGLIIAGIPFQQAQEFIYFFWIVGALFVFSGISFYVKDKLFRLKTCKKII